MNEPSPLLKTGQIDTASPVESGVKSRHEIRLSQLQSILDKRTNVPLLTDSDLSQIVGFCADLMSGAEVSHSFLEKSEEFESLNRAVRAFLDADTREPVLIEGISPEGKKVLRDRLENLSAFVEYVTELLKKKEDKPNRYDLTVQSGFVVANTAPTPPAPQVSREEISQARMVIVKMIDELYIALSTQNFEASFSSGKIDALQSLLTDKKYAPLIEELKKENQFMDRLLDFTHECVLLLESPDFNQGETKNGIERIRDLFRDTFFPMKNTSVGAIPDLGIGGNGAKGVEGTTHTATPFQREVLPSQSAERNTFPKVGQEVVPQQPEPEVTIAREEGFSLKRLEEFLVGDDLEKLPSNAVYGNNLDNLERDIRSQQIVLTPLLAQRIRRTRELLTVSINNTEAVITENSKAMGKESELASAREYLFKRQRLLTILESLYSGGALSKALSEGTNEGLRKRASNVLRGALSGAGRFITSISKGFTMVRDNGVVEKMVQESRAEDEEKKEEGDSVPTTIPEESTIPETPPFVPNLKQRENKGAQEAASRAYELFMKAQGRYEKLDRKTQLTMSAGLITAGFLGAGASALPVAVAFGTTKLVLRSFSAIAAAKGTEKFIEASSLGKEWKDKSRKIGWGVGVSVFLLGSAGDIVTWAEMLKTKIEGLAHLFQSPASAPLPEVSAPTPPPVAVQAESAPVSAAPIISGGEVGTSAASSFHPISVHEILPEQTLSTILQSDDIIRTLVGDSPENVEKISKLNPFGKQNFVANIIMQLSPAERLELGLGPNAETIAGKSLNVEKLAEWVKQMKTTMPNGESVSLLDRALSFLPPQ